MSSTSVWKRAQLQVRPMTDDRSPPPSWLREWVDALLDSLPESPSDTELDEDTSLAETLDWMQDVLDDVEEVLNEDELEFIRNGVEQATPDESQPASMSRARLWIQNFLDSDNETMVAVGRNFEYLLDHVDEWESSELSFEDLPTLEVSDRWLICSSVAYGTYWPSSDSTVYAVEDADGHFIGLYGHEENADERAADVDGAGVEPIRPNGPDPREYVERFLDADGAPQQSLGTVFEFMLDNREAFESGNLSPDEFPLFDQNTKWLIAYSTLFGMLWELSHPSLHGVFDANQQLRAIYWDPKEAAAAAEDFDRAHYTQRLSVADGDLPPEDVIGTIEPATAD